MDGAKALALPTKFGQSMVVSNTRGSDLIWEAYDTEKVKWFKSNISLYDFSGVRTTDEAVSAQLKMILKAAVNQNSEFLSKWNGFKVQTYLDFDRSWGLGSSSTLYCLIAEWAEVNPLLLYFDVEDGSGYDVACGWAEGPITYINSPEEISYSEIDFNPKFKDQLYFVHLNKKKNSRDAIAHYRKEINGHKSMIVQDLTQITDDMINCNSLSSFNHLIDAHEDCISKTLHLPKIKNEQFKDYWGSIKSLGAWGGDFILATSDHNEEDTKQYFHNQGFPTVFSYDDMIIS